MNAAFTSQPTRRARPLLGTIVEISADVRGAIEPAFSAVEKVQRLMSYHDPFSEVTRLNSRACAAPVQVSLWTFEVLTAAQELARESGGAFDITVAPRLASWGYLPRTQQNNRNQRLAIWQ